MTSDHASHANELTHRALHPYFGDRLFPDLGLEALNLTRRRLHAAGFADDGHAEEVFARALQRALAYLRRTDGASVVHPRAWFHTICRRETYAYIREVIEKDSQTLSSLLGGETEIAASRLYDEERVLALVREAIKRLRPRFREFVELDILKCLPPEDIQAKMKIRSPRYFRKLKSEALSALRHAIQTLLDKGIDSLF